MMIFYEIESIYEKEVLCAADIILILTWPLKLKK